MSLNLGARRIRWSIVGILVLVVISIGVSVLVLSSGDTGVNDDSDAHALMALEGKEVQSSLSGKQVPLPTPWQTIALVIMSIATLVSIAITFYLYKWRRILLAQPNALVPEDWVKYLNGVGQHVSLLTDSVTKSLGLVVQETERNTGRVSNMIDTFMTLQKAIDERDEEIKRLKRGYDADVFRKFLNRFIRVDQLIDVYKEQESAESDSLHQIKRLMDDALDECGVESFQPSIGDDSRLIDGISDNPKKLKTEIKDDDFKIIEVIEPGYWLRDGDGHDVLIPAKVKIAVFEE